MLAIILKLQLFGERIFRESRAVTAMEYALIAAFIFLVIIVSVTAVGTNLTPIFNHVSSEL